LAEGQGFSRRGLLELQKSRERKSRKENYPKSGPSHRGTDIEWGVREAT